jgi:hypothetical protein
VQARDEDRDRRQHVDRGSGGRPGNHRDQDRVAHVHEGEKASDESVKLQVRRPLHEADRAQDQEPGGAIVVPRGFGVDVAAACDDAGDVLEADLVPVSIVAGGEPEPQAETDAAGKNP